MPKRQTHATSKADSRFVAPSLFNDFHVNGVLVQALVPLNDAANEETPTSPEGSEGALVDGAGIGGGEAESATEGEADPLFSLLAMLGK